MKITASIAIIVFLVTSVFAYKIHGWRVDSLRVEWEAEKVKAVDSAKAEVQAVCDENNQTTKEQAHALQVKYNATVDRYNRLLQYKPSGTSVSAIAGVAGGYNDQTDTDVPTLHITLSDWANIAKQNDDQASALITLQDVVADIYRRNGQENLLPAGY